MNWFLPAILASLFWGVGQTLIKKGLSDLSPYMSIFIGTIFALILYIPYSLVSGIKLDSFPGILVFGFLANLPNYVFPYILKKANVSLSGTVVATYPIYTIALSLIFLHESLDFFQIFGILVIILGMFMVAKPENEKLKIASWVIWALLGSIVIGLGDFIGKVTLTKYDLSSFILALAIGGIPALLVFRLFDKSKIKMGKISSNVRAGLLGNLIMPIGLIALYTAFNNGPASLASPVASTYPAITAVLAYFYLKEKLNRNQILGIIAVTIGVIFIGI
ncbi:MAG: EamA family transporter [Patescibacteria group bacterium]